MFAAAGLFVSRLATSHDVPRILALMDDAITVLQRGFLTAGQMEASRRLMGLDRQLIADGTYFVVEEGETLAGVGGWSRRATLFGGDHTPGRDDRLLDPSHDAARIRAMYTAPSFARRGVGRLVLGLCERAAAAEGFGRAELGGTLAGEPLYTACGYRVIERFDDARFGTPVPLVRMGKALA